MIVLVSDLIESLALWILMDGIVLMIGRPEVNLDPSSLPRDIDCITFTLRFGGIQSQEVHLLSHFKKNVIVYAIQRLPYGQRLQSALRSRTGSLQEASHA